MIKCYQKNLVNYVVVTSPFYHTFRQSEIRARLFNSFLDLLYNLLNFIFVYLFLAERVVCLGSNLNEQYELMWKNLRVLH